jgi:hypothetical protein
MRVNLNLMTEIDVVIAATFDLAEKEEKCQAAAIALRCLHEAGGWEPAQILKAIATNRETDEGS